MSVSVFDHPWLSELFADEEIQAVWSAESSLSHMLSFERALVEARFEAGEIPKEIRDETLRHIERFRPDMESLRQGIKDDGVVVPSLVRGLRENASKSQAEAIHSGASSQDAIDTALAMTLRDSSELLGKRLRALPKALEALESKFGGVEIMGRTRMQAALPIRASLRISAWRGPLERELPRFESASKGAALLQLGGPTGDRKSLGPNAERIAESMAEALKLKAPEGSWHTQRDSLARYAGSLCAITNATGKIGMDCLLMAQQGINEIQFDSGGSSSSMTHKSNPVLAEALVTLSRFNAGLLPLMNGTAIHEQERSGSAWTLEWMTLPQMIATTASALKNAQRMIERVKRIGNE